MLDEQVDEVLANPDSLESLSHPIIYHHLLKPQKGYQIPPALSLKDEALLLVNAGVDTVSNALIVGIINTLENREICAKLQAELREAWPVLEEKRKFEELESLPYLVLTFFYPYFLSTLRLIVLLAESGHQRSLTSQSWNHHPNGSSCTCGRGKHHG